MKTLEERLTHSFKTYGVSIPKELVREIWSEAFEAAGEVVEKQANTGHGKNGIHNMTVRQCSQAILSLAKQVEEGKQICDGKESGE